MPDTSELRRDLEAAIDRFEQYRASVSGVLDERPAGEMSRALDAILPDLVFYEGQACAAGLALARLDAGGESDGGTAVDAADAADTADTADTVDGVARVLGRGLIEQQAARRGSDFLAGFAAMLARAHSELPD